MCKIAYLVFAYRNPQLLKREIACLSNGNSAFFVHIDKKIDINQFSSVVGENVFYLKNRVVVRWGEFSGVEAILSLIRQALSNPTRYDYLVLLSGSEYPLRSSGYIHTYLREHDGEEFISLARMPSPGKPISRISTVRVESNKPVRRFGWRLLAKAGWAERNYRYYLRDLVPYSGITWWALSRNACEYLLHFSEENPHVARFFRDTFAPEESFIHTILGNSPLKDRVRGNLLFEDWTPPDGDPRRAVRGQLPQSLTSEHIAFFETQKKVWLDDTYGRREALFARKFSDNSLGLVDRLDTRMAREDSWQGDQLPSHDGFMKAQLHITTS